MDTAKAGIQGNAAVVTTPKSFNVEPDTEYRFTKGKGGVLTLTPVKGVPSSIEELLKDWHSEYQVPGDLKEWQDVKPEGEGLW